MKRVVLLLFMAFSWWGIQQGYAINIPHKFGCDTIFMKGNYEQLKQIEANITNELKKPLDQLDKASLYTLMGDNLVALGRYADALSWYELGQKTFETIDYNRPGAEGGRYYYFCCLSSHTKLQLLMGEETNTVIASINKTIQTLQPWLPYAEKEAVSGKNRYVSAQLLYASISMSFFTATLESVVRKFSSAIKEYELCIQAIEDGFKGKARQTLEYAQVLYAMADVYERNSNYEQALSYFQQSLDVTEKLIGSNTAYYAQILSRMGGVNYSLNDLIKAASLFQRSINIFNKLGFKEHSELAVSYSGMGMWALNAKELDISLEYFREAHREQKLLCGAYSYRAHLTKLYTAYPLLMKGRLDEAWTIANVLRERPIMNNISSDNLLNGLTLTLDIGLLRREYDGIIDLYRDFEELIEVLGTVNKHSLRNVNLNFARAYRRKGDYRNAAVQLHKVLDLQRDLAHDNFTFLTEEQRSNYWAVDESRMNSLFCANNAMGSNSTYVGKLLYDVALLNKGILLEASVNLAEVVYNSNDAALQKKLSDLRLLRQELAATGRPDNGEAKALEGEIVKSAKQYGDFMDFVSITWKDVQAGLGKNDVAIEFVSSLYEGVYTYSAEVLRQGMKEPRHIPLFKLPEAELSALRAAPGRFSDFACKNIWTSELLACLKPGDNVCFVPSGELYNIGIEYIPLPSGKRMCDVYRMKRLSSTRELTVKRGAQHTRSAALFGGLNYNASVSDMELYAYATAVRGSKSKRFSAQGTAGFDAWGYLPGTGQEVESISGSLSPYQYSIQSYMGDEGVEEAFKALSGKQTEIIHIATHGYYFPGVGNALDNSGLVFAGANNFWNKKGQTGTASGIDDGILTAREISFLNLQGADLVVMSACQTGLGRVTGEGVFGLQRAFKKAGVQTLLMSLWEVDDEATQLLMSEFYKVYAEGGDKREALRRAQQKIKQHTFRRNGKEVSGANPYYWAAFIMMD